ncbi:glycerate kinase, partial [Bacillaceae bacterium SIJ1]|uniref:glycerate kinase n=1 Tax=Litoribacterium kuwaitense TaxID=1398745 RepID=UPI0013EDEB7C
KNLGIQIMDVPGAGAAGGLGAGLKAFCGADIQSGIDKIIEIIDIEKYLLNTDLVITGEGRMDSQSVQGKAPIGVSKIAKKHHIPVIAIVGCEGERIHEVYHNGIDLVIDIINEPMDIDTAMGSVALLTENAGEKAIRSYLLREVKYGVKEETSI